MDSEQGMDGNFGRGKNKQFWNDEETWALIQCLQELAADPAWKTDTGFKNNYMTEVRRMLIQKDPRLAKDIRHVDSRIRFLKTKFHALSEMCKQSGCTWNAVDNKIVCERSWYDDWMKTHKDARGLYNMSFPYMSALDTVYGKDRATGRRVEDPVESTRVFVEADGAPVVSSEDILRREWEVEFDSAPTQQPSQASTAETSGVKMRRLPKRQKGACAGNSSEAKLDDLASSVKGFLSQFGKQFDSLSNWIQGGSNKSNDVLELLERHGFTGAEKLRAARAICQDTANVELLFCLNPANLDTFVRSFL